MNMHHKVDAVESDRQHQSAAMSPGTYADPSRNPEPRTYRHTMETLAKASSLVCAGAAGIAVASGLISPDDGILSGMVVPISAGGALTVAIASGWHILHTAAIRVRDALGYCAVVGAGVALSAATIGASSWPVATVLAGAPAVRQHMSLTIVNNQRALEDVWTQAHREAGMIDSVLAAEAEMRGMNDLEANRGGISELGRGAGPNSQILAAGARSYARLADTMQGAHAQATLAYQKGKQALAQMRLNVHGDAERFVQAAADVETAVSDLNAYRLTDFANKAGVFQAEVWQLPGAVEQVRSGADKISAKVLQRAQEIAQVREVVTVPVYTPLERREATWRYASGAAAGGWITGIAIDVIPFLLALLLLSTHAARKLDEEVPRRRK
jgi:hypothetical protein